MVEQKHNLSILFVDLCINIVLKKRKILLLAKGLQCTKPGYITNQATNNFGHKVSLGIVSYPFVKLREGGYIDA